MTIRKKPKQKASRVKPVAGTIGDRETAGKAAGEREAAESPAAAFPIVGIGASAGGLAAFETFFSGMPADADPGMAFVLVQHLDPGHKSLLAELVRRYTRMQVFEAEDGIVVRPNCVYIIPPNRDMALLNGTLQLLEPSAPRGQRLPIDFFFRSLAQDQRERAVCVVLSGTGSDGTMGVRAVKSEGGMVMVQSPASTEYDGMPCSAIGTGLADYELPPGEMPARLIAYAARAFGEPPRPGPVPEAKDGSALKKIFLMLRTQTGHDFSQYKPDTIHRRIKRRMAVQQIETIDGYVKRLQQAPAEVEALFRDLLIGVTGFFRDPPAFKALEEQVIAKLFDGKSPGEAVRVWVPGCSTGEEAYSIAILLRERLETLKRSYQVQVFATDIDSRAIAAARTGLYPAGIAAGITPERLARFFSAEPGGAYRIHKGLRDMLVFSEQDVVMDPPFSKLDLISCRNLLIYMGGDLQKKLIPLFHYALNPGGFLFLGTSETVGECGDLFDALDRKLKLYRHKEHSRGAVRAAMGWGGPPTAGMGAACPPAGGKTAGPGKPPLRELAEAALLQYAAPAGALVNGSGDILYLHGRTGLYLEPVPGEAGLSNILKMAREGLGSRLAAALHKAVSGKEPVRCPGLRVKTNGDFTTVNLTVRPVAAGPAAASGASLYLVTLEEAPASGSGEARPAAVPQAGEEALRPDKPAGRSARADSDARVAALKQELLAKEKNLQAVNEQLETSIEELKSANEEMQSVNEELQSTNEELETSKEELQSLNEELSTVNTELQTKVADLSRANNDMKNLLAGTGIATVFVDQDLRILRFTPAATQIINLILSDMGRPVGHIVSNLKGYDRLAADARTVLDTLVPKEMEVQTTEGKWFIMRVHPYRTLDNVIEGVVITFVDITALKKAQAELQNMDVFRRLAAVVLDSRDAVILQDLDGRILAWNPRAQRLYGWSEAEALAMNIRDIIPENQREEALSVVRQLSRGTMQQPYRAQRIAKDGRKVDVRLIATALVDGRGEAYAIATTEEEIIS